MKNLYRAVIAVMSAVISVGVSAEQCKHLVVTSINGGRTVYRLDHNPNLQFQDNSLVISGDSITLEIPLNTTDKITYESFDPTGIDGISDNSGIRISDDGMEINIAGLSSSTTAYIYGINGQLLGTYRLASGKNEVVSLRQLPKGVYILKLNGQSYKFQKK